MQLENMVALDLLKQIEKHLAGRHDQKSHGHGGSSKHTYPVVSSANKNYSEINALIKRLPASHFNNLQIAVSDTDPIITYPDKAYYTAPDDMWGKPGNMVLGPEATAQTFLHELGHHMIETEFPSVADIAKDQNDLREMLRENTALFDVGWEYGLGGNEATRDRSHSLEELRTGIYRRFANAYLGDEQAKLDVKRFSKDFPYYGKIVSNLFERTEKVKHLPGKHDQSRHAGSRAQATHPATGRILNAYKLPIQFKPMTDDELRWSFGTTKEPYLKDERGFLVQGELVSPGDLPSTVYHVTTRADAVEQSGMLKGFAGLDSGGIGGHTTEGVSLTSSMGDAVNIKRQVKRVIELAHSDEDLETVLHNWAREDERIANLSTGKLDDAVSEALRFYNVNAAAPVYAESADALGRLRIEAARHYRTFAENRGAPQDVLIFGTDFAKLQPEDVQIFEVPKDALFASGGAVLDKVAPGDFLHEVRVYGDVPMDDARILRE